MKTVFFVVGPTASGKSAVALELARRIGGEIISCDSMQVYRGMNIGAAKPDAREQKQARHHLVDLLKPSQECSVFRHRKFAERAVFDILRRGKIPILAGGSGFYVKTLLDGLASQPGQSARLRKQLAGEANRRGLKYLYARLRRIDPRRAAEIDPNDQRRIIRALEIWLRLKKRPSERKEPENGLLAKGVQARVFGLLWNRQELCRRIEDRTDRMLEGGWIDEAKGLRKIRMSKTAKAAIGYPELFRYLDGTMNLQEAAGEIKKKTRRLAKKQMTWFRKDSRIEWLSVSGNHFVKPCVRRILKVVNG